MSEKKIQVTCSIGSSSDNYAGTHMYLARLSLPAMHIQLTPATPATQSHTATQPNMAGRLSRRNNTNANAMAQWWYNCRNSRMSIHSTICRLDNGIFSWQVSRFYAWQACNQFLIGWLVYWPTTALSVFLRKVLNVESSRRRFYSHS